MAASLKLYTNPMSRGRTPRWMLEELGEPYDVEYVQYGEAMKSAAFVAMNPMGKVPVLLHGDTVVTEVPAICAYLAAAFPRAGLAPRDEELAAYHRWMYFVAGPFEAAQTNRALGVVVPPERESMVGYGRYETVMDALEAACAGTPYIAGERFTAADVVVGAAIGFGLRFGSIEKRPAFEEYFARLSGRDAFVRASEADDAAMAAQQTG